MTAYLNLIGNQWLAAEDGTTFAVDNPATEAQFATVSAASTAVQRVYVQETGHDALVAKLKTGLAADP